MDFRPVGPVTADSTLDVSVCARYIRMYTHCILTIFGWIYFSYFSGKRDDDDNRFRRWLLCLCYTHKCVNGARICCAVVVVKTLFVLFVRQKTSSSAHATRSWDEEDEIKKKGLQKTCHARIAIHITLSYKHYWFMLFLTIEFGPDILSATGQGIYFLMSTLTGVFFFFTL
jgi:hypothetical protein